MVHLRARNLPEKGVVTKWLFETDEIKNGDDFALVRTESNQELIIKSNFEGVVVKTIKLGSTIKNGSILANIAVGPKEIARFRNRLFKPGEEPVDFTKHDIAITAPGLEKLEDAVDELDNISGAVMYDRNYQAVTPFSSGNDIMDTPEKYKEILKRDEKMKEEEKKAVAANQPKDRFAQMRANIAASIKNAPQMQNNLSDEEKAKLATMSNEDALKDGNLFASTGGGASKFRQLIQSRKEKLLKENDFQEVKDEDLQVDAMSKLDDKGRPLIMRNIIANRLEKFKAAGGDPNAIENEVVATKENAPKNAKLTAKQLLMDGDDRYIKPEQETPSMYKVPNNEDKIVNSVVPEGPFARQKSSDDGEFGVTFGAYVDDGEDILIDSNDMSNTGSVMMPQKDHKQLLNEIKQKTEKTYAESKLANLYDSNRRWEIIKSRGQLNGITKRKHMLEEGTLDPELPKVSETRVDESNIPPVFLAETVLQDPSGQVRYVKYMDTPKGREEFDNWLRTSNLYATYYDAMEDPAMRTSENVHHDSTVKSQNMQNLERMRAMQQSGNGTRTNNAAQSNITQSNYGKSQSVVNQHQQVSVMSQQDLIAQQEMAEREKQRQISAQAEQVRQEHERQEHEEQERLNKQLAEVTTEFKTKITDQDRTIDYLKKQIDNLMRQLKEKDSLELASKKLENEYGNSNGSFNQMMQLMMMQNIMHPNNPSPMMPYPTPSATATPTPEQLDLKKLIQDQLNEFKASILKETQALQKSSESNRTSSQATNMQQDLQQVDFQSRPNFNEMKERDKDVDYVNVPTPDDSVLQREVINPTSLPAVKSMILSQSYIPPLTISTEVDMTSILKLKHVLKKTDTTVMYPTILFITKALSLALNEYPRLNSSYDPETNEVVVKAYHNIGLATETNEGLIIPVLKFVEKLSLRELAIDIKEMTERLRRGELYNYETSGSTITLANYGNIGAIQATPTIFYPNAAVIGVGKVVKKPVVVRNEKVEIKAMMNVSLTVDQRIIDSATAGRFLTRMKDILEKPELISVS